MCISPKNMYQLPTMMLNVIREMQTRTLSHPKARLCPQKTDRHECWWHCQKVRTAYTTGGHVKRCSRFGNKARHVLKTLNAAAIWPNCSTQWHWKPISTYVTVRAGSLIRAKMQNTPNLLHPCNEMLFSHKQGMKFWYMLQHRWALKTLC